MKTYGVRLLPMSLFPGLLMAVCRTAGLSVMPLLSPADILIKEQFAVDFVEVYSSKPAGKKKKKKTQCEMHSRSFFTWLIFAIDCSHRRERLDDITVRHRVYENKMLWKSTTLLMKQTYLAFAKWLFVHRELFNVCINDWMLVHYSA